MAAMMLFAVSFIACNNDDVDKGNGNGNNTPEPPQVEEVTFVISGIEATLTDVTYTVTPSNDDSDYLVFICNANAVEMCDFDEEIVEMLYSDVEEYATANGTTLNDYLATKVKRGKIENATVGNLTYNTNYYVLAFAVDAANNYEAISPIEMERFATAKPAQTACTFEMKYSVYQTNVSLTVIPSDNTQLWHLINVPVSEYQKYTSADGEYGWTQQQFFQNHLNTEIEELRNAGLSNEEIGIKLFHKGTRTLSDTGLAPKTKHVALAGAVSYTDGAALLTSATKETRYNSGEAAISDLAFDIDVYNIDAYSADIKITPSDLNAEYYYYIGYINTNKSNMKPIDIANAAVTEHIYYVDWDDNAQLKRLDPVKGVIDLTGENKYQLDLAETEYFIVAFSFAPNPTYGTVIDEEGTYDYNPGNITSTPVYVSFKTPEHGDPTKAEFTFTATEVGPYDFYFEITNNDPTIYYMPGIAKAEGFDPQATLNGYASFLAQQILGSMEGQSPCLTIQEALETRCSAFFRNGNGKYYTANLFPETSYVSYALAIDVKTGTFAKCYYSDVIATTTAVGNVDPTIELLGVYDGNEENGTIFNDAEKTEDCPIVAVKIKNVENASAIFATKNTDKNYNVTEKSDQNLISDFRGYWDEVKSLTTPYYFYIGAWDNEYTVLAYAQDANGAEGKVARLAVKPEASGDIEELRGYVAEYNNSMPKALTKSLVVASEGEPTIECIWSEEVGAPRDAEVTYHEVEPLQLASDLVRVKVIKSFHI